MKNITINLEELKKHNLSLDDFYVLMKLHYKEEISPVFNDICPTLEEKGFIKINTVKNSKLKAVLRHKGVLFIHKLQAKIEEFIPETSEFAIEQDIKQAINGYRAKWSGLKAGAMGSEDSCIKKLKRWLKSNPKHSMKEVLIASDNYIESLHQDFRFLQQADYFIYKKEGKEETSRLSAFIDDLKDDKSNNRDWTSQIN